MPDGIVFRAARESDWHELRALLAGARLPLEGARENLGGFLLAHRDSALIGSACVERYGANGLLRSVAVAESERGKGLGIALIGQVLARAREQRLESLFILTETARGFFPRFGFREVARDDVPEAVKASVEFQSVCPISATVMRLDLASQVTIRAATESDLPAILAVYNDAVLTTTASYDDEPCCQKLSGAENSVATGGTSGSPTAGGIDPKGPTDAGSRVSRRRRCRALHRLPRR